MAKSCALESCCYRDFHTFLLEWYNNEWMIQMLWSVFDIASAHRSVICKVIKGNRGKNENEEIAAGSRLSIEIYMVAKLINANSTLPISCCSNQILQIDEWTSSLSLSLSLSLSFSLSFSWHIQLAASYLPSSYLASFPLASLAPPLLSLAPKTRWSRS